jgi:N-acetylmuramoyl-L-alanine amidase
MTPGKIRFMVWNFTFTRRLLPVFLLVLAGLVLYKTVEAEVLFSSSFPWAPGPVVIDAGHGGYDPGVMSADGTMTEKALTLSLARKVRAKLEQRGIRVLLTRDGDTDFAQRGATGKTAKRQDLNYRIHVAQSHNASIFISIHVNNFPLATRGGAEVFYHPDVPGAKRLAAAIQSSLHQVPGMERRAAKPETFYLLRNLSMPAVIVEAGYLSIPSEKQRLRSESYQNLLAEAIAEGVVRFLRDPDASPP